MDSADCNIYYLFYNKTKIKKLIESEDIRVSIKAVIVKDGLLLAAKKQDADGYFYTLPGGGQNHSENMEQALIRECLEEINVNVKPLRLLFIRDYIAKNHEIKKHAERNVHHIEIMFETEIKEGIPSNGCEPDNGQLSVEWIRLDELNKLRLYPKAMCRYLMNYVELIDAVYLGDVN